METIINLIEFLPKYEEITNFAQEEREAIYIFQLVLNSLEKYKNKITCYDSLQESLYLIESLIEKMWEKINTGHFSEVPINIRKIYSTANFFKIIIILLDSHTEKTQLEQCCEYMDKSILIGCTENLYKQKTQFFNQLNEFLNRNLDSELDSNLLYIEPLKFQEINCDIPILDCPTIEYFNRNFFQIKQPVVLRNIINHWPALQKWRNLNYLLKIAGNRSVPIEIGINYTDENWSQELIKIKDFLKRHFSKSFMEECKDENNIEYLAQHELFDQIPILKDDIRIPDYCCCTDNNIINTTDQNDEIFLKDLIDIKAWLGPNGTISPMHQDPKNNILCQVFGKKNIILASPDDTINLYPHETGFLNNTAAIDAENLDFIKYPLLKNVKFFYLTLQEGECLYIPPKWWHFVKSLSKSFSVSFWWE